MFNRLNRPGIWSLFGEYKQVTSRKKHAREVGGNFISHPYCTDKAKNTTLIHNIYDSGTLKTAEGDIVI